MIIVYKIKSQQKYKSIKSLTTNRSSNNLFLKRKYEVKKLKLFSHFVHIPLILCLFGGRTSHLFCFLWQYIWYRYSRCLCFCLYVHISSFSSIIFLFIVVLCQSTQIALFVDNSPFLPQYDRYVFAKAS